VDGKAVRVTAVSDTQVKVAPPGLAAGSHPLVVTTVAGASSPLAIATA
jgi:hypothetical protein